MKLTQIPSELLDPWYEKYEKLFLIPAIPRCSGGWSYGIGGKESIYLGFGEYGYCQLIPESRDELYLFFIYIYLEYRGNGYGRGFMIAIIKLSKELNYKRIRLDVGYLNPKDKIPVTILRKFYNGLGFKREKGQKWY